MSNNSNYSGISNKTDARQMMGQMLSKEAKVVLLCGLCQAETGSLWSGLESLTYSCSLVKGYHTGGNSEEILVEGETEERQATEREKCVSEVQQGAACTRP
ncbi:hypothetical protein DSO57_1034843 [Entomophthora muscae]|uniref:Uncharacterized protein n=1 Tax=Entomophthora muscae TaxID=34485 RepID=A0ACC2TYC6_9FUNG|nr:hypothetical protein DSO57_1034843 [Entomophthora muscae]